MIFILVLRILLKIVGPKYLFYGDVSDISVCWR